MTEDLIDGALTSSTQLEYDGNEITVKAMDQGDADTIREQNRQAVKAALNELKGIPANATVAV